MPLTHKSTGCASCRTMIKNATSAERKTTQFKTKLLKHHNKQKKKLIKRRDRIAIEIKAMREIPFPRGKVAKTTIDRGDRKKQRTRKKNAERHRQPSGTMRSGPIMSADERRRREPSKVGRESRTTSRREYLLGNTTNTGSQATHLDKGMGLPRNRRSVGIDGRK